MWKDNRIYEHENNVVSDEYVDEVDGREYEMIYLMDKSDYDDNDDDKRVMWKLFRLDRIRMGFILGKFRIILKRDYRIESIK